VVRAQVDRRLLQSDFKLFETLAYEASALWCYTVQIPQRGGRRAREAKLLLRSATVELLAPAGRAVEKGSLSVNVVLAEELNAQAQSEPLRWVLLTTEAVSSAEEARQVVRYDELRWRIEIDQPYCLHKSVFRKLLHRFRNWFYPGMLNRTQFA
jgi:hypothetical protein